MLVEIHQTANKMELGERQEYEARMKIHCKLKWKKEVFYSDLVGFETKKLISKAFFSSNI